jgi:hypothetical protein
VLLTLVILVLAGYVAYFIFGLDEFARSLYYAFRVRHAPSSIAKVIAKSLTNGISYKDWVEEYNANILTNEKVGLRIFRHYDDDFAIEYEKQHLKFDKFERYMLLLALKERRQILRDDTVNRRIEADSKQITDIASKFCTVYDDEKFPKVPPWIDHPAVLEAAGHDTRTGPNDEFELLHMKPKELPAPQKKKRLSKNYSEKMQKSA